MSSKRIIWGIGLTVFVAGSAYLLYRTYKYLYVTFDDFVKVILKNEGGLSLDPNDPGNWTKGLGKGELKGTKYGISSNAFPDLDIKNLTIPQAAQIYKTTYWEPLNLSGLNSDSLKLQIFDHGVNAGKSSAAKLLQQLIKSPKTGTITNDDIKRANQYLAVGTDLTKYYKDLRKSDYKTKSNYPIYGQAWEARVDKTNLTFF